MGLSWICTIHMNIDLWYVVDCETVISAVLICFLLSISINLYNHQNTTDVFLTMIMTHIHGAKCKQSVLKTALTLEVYNCEGSRWFIHNLKTQTAKNFSFA